MTPPSEATPNPDRTSWVSWTSSGPIGTGAPSPRGDLDPLTVGQSSGERAVVRRQSGGDGLYARAEARAEDLEVRFARHRPNTSADPAISTA